MRCVVDGFGPSVGPHNVNRYLDIAAAKARPRWVGWTSPDGDTVTLALASAAQKKRLRALGLLT